MSVWHTRLAAADRALAEGRWREAAAAYQLAIAAFPEHAVLHHALAQAWEGVGDLNAAVAAAQRAVTLDARDDLARYDLARLYWRQQQADTAWQTLAPLLTQPTAEVCHLAGRIAAMRGDAAAGGWLARATRLSPKTTDFRLDLGNWHFDQADWSAAERCYQAVADDAQGAYNLGRVAEQRQAWSDACRHYQQALALAPNLAEAHWNLALLLLRQGDYLAAWPHFARRWERPALAQIAPPPHVPRWQGEPLAGRTLLVWAEQGFGDTLQFLRFLSWIDGGRVLLRCQPQLQRLLSAQPGISLADDQSAVDLQCALLDLPGLLQADPARIVLRAAPYLQVPPAWQSNWAERLPPRPRIGLVWAGRPEHAQDRERSMAITELAPLAALPIHWVALQKGPAAAQVADWPGTITALDEHLQDFADTAAVLAQLDGLVTVDTAVAHLAGALGVPVWLLLHQRGEWRWLEQGTGSPWYPGMTLLRQTIAGQWAGPVQQLSTLLSQHNFRPSMTSPA